MKKNLTTIITILSIFAASLSFSFAETLNSNLTDGETIPACLVLTSPNLHYGSTDAKTDGQVSFLQDFLIDKGFLTGLPTGFYGLKTTRAVMLYQKSKGVAQAGRVGPLSRMLIKKDTCETPIVTTTPEVPLCTQEMRYCPNGTPMPRDTGSCAWLESKCSTFASTTPTVSKSQVISSARQKLANSLGVSTNLIITVSSDTVSWPNGCLGIPQPSNVICTQAQVQGYKILFKYQTTQYEYRTNMSGTQIAQYKKTTVSSSTDTATTGSGTETTAPVTKTPTCDEDPRYCSPNNLRLFNTFAFQDLSYGNGSIILRQKMYVYGRNGHTLGEGLLACFYPQNSSCEAVGGRRPVSSMDGWTYDAAVDAYRIDKDVSALQYAHTAYYASFKTAAGYASDIMWTPTKVSASSTSSN